MTSTTDVLQELRFPTLHDALLHQTERLLEEAKGQDTTSEDFLGGFSYLFWNGWEQECLQELEPIVSLLTTPEHKAITELNLAIANANSNWRDFPIGCAVANYLNDFLNYLLARIINLEDWRAGFEKHYRIFEQEYLADEFTVEFFGHIGNFAYDYADTGEIDDHTNVIVLSTLGTRFKHEALCEKTANYFRVRKALSDARFPLDANKLANHPQFLHYTKKLKKQVGKPAFDAYELMRKFVFGVRILSPYGGKPYCNAIAAFHQGRLSPSFFGLSGSMVFPEGEIEDDGRETAKLSSTANTWLRRLWAKLEGLDYENRLTALDHHIDDSLRRGTRSAKNPYAERLKLMDNLERLSDYFSAFDSMYKTKPGETTKKLPLYTGRLVTYKRNPQDRRNPAEWDKIAEFVREMYRLRGDYEHGRVGEALQKAGSPQRFEARVREIKGYLYQVAILYVMNDDFEAQLPRVEGGDFSGLQNIYY